MTPCKECIVDMVCTQQCPLFEIDLQRLQTDEDIYLKRCMKNIEHETYKISENVKVEICEDYIWWYKDRTQHRDNDNPALITYRGTKYRWRNGECHRDNNQPAVIYSNGMKEWYKNGKRHRDNNLPALIYPNGIRRWYRNGVQYEPM